MTARPVGARIARESRLSCEELGALYIFQSTWYCSTEVFFVIDELHHVRVCIQYSSARVSGRADVFFESFSDSDILSDCLQARYSLKLRDLGLVCLSNCLRYIANHSTKALRRRWWKYGCHRRDSVAITPTSSISSAGSEMMWLL